VVFATESEPSLGLLTPMVRVCRHFYVSVPLALQIHLRSEAAC
jgi:hypothetical protein